MNLISVLFISASLVTWVGVATVLLMEKEITLDTLIIILTILFVFVLNKAIRRMI